jgi:hypothetical protein
MLMREKLGEELWWMLNFGSAWYGWCSNEPIGAYGVGLWKNIRRGWEKFHCHNKFEVGVGSKVRFWHDLWCRDKALNEAVPDLYGIACGMMPLLRPAWNFLVALISGTLTLIEQLMIGRWLSLPHSLASRRRVSEDEPLVDLLPKRVVQCYIFLQCTGS